MSIYRYERRLELALLDIFYSEKMIPDNMHKVLDYHTFLEATGKSLPRQDKLIRTLEIFATLLNPILFKKATKQDVVNALAK